MEQHPVPQNVTTFQFRLIGDMTIKQFGYLCGGAILAFISYKLPLPFIITWPLTIVFAFLGIGFAFVPVEERPMDVWVFSFFKSIYSPTQYLWNREPPRAEPAPASVAPTPPPATAQTVNAPHVQIPPTVTPIPAPVHSAIDSVPSSQPPVHKTTGAAPVAPPAPPAPSNAVLTDLFQQAPPTPHVTVHHQAKNPSLFATFWDDLLALFLPKKKILSAQPPARPVSRPVVTVPSVTGLHPVVPAQTQAPQVIQKPAEDHAIKEKMATLEENINKLEERLASKTTVEDRVLELQKQLTDLLQQKSKTDDELTSLRRKMVNQEPPPPQPANAQHGSVNVITTQEGAVRAGLPRLTNVPNVITGLVKDDAADMLPGILVTVTNSDGVPMRALKTNKLGQFAASTPLAPGVYYVEVEDPRKRFTFSRVQITLNGGVVPLLEIIAKSEKILTREKLAQEIFGGQKMQ